MGTENKKKGNQAQVEQQNHYTSNNITTSRTVPEANVCVIPVTLDENNVIDGALEIVKVIRPNWNINLIDFKLFTDGITNKLVGCFHTGTDIPSSEPTELGQNGDTTNEDDVKQQSQEEEVDETQHNPYFNSVVLVRVYGNKTDLLIDRKAETRNIKLLHTYGFAPTLFAVFNNGLAYEYVPGCTLTAESVREPKVWSLIARRMAEMHKVDCGQEVPLEPMLWNKTQQFLNLVPDQFCDFAKHKRLEKDFLPVQRLRDEFSDLYKRLEQLGSPIVFAHNDLLLGNVIYTESVNRVTFIDYEYAAYNFQAFDIGNHFTEFAGIDEIDYSRYPSKEFQLEWLTTYLETYLGTTEISSRDIDRLYVQVNQFALASHFFWAIWALIQAEHSNIDFDFIKFAQARYYEYRKRRDTFLSL